MGYIVVRPRDTETAKGFRGVVFIAENIDKVLDTYEEMGGAEHAQIVFVRRRDAHKIDVQVLEPPDGQRGHQTTPQELS